MNYSLVRAVLEDTWAISLQSYLQYQHILHAILTGMEFEMDSNSLEPVSRFWDLQSASYVEPNGKSDSQKGIIAVHSINGPMLKYDTACGPVGTKTIAREITNADNTPDVIAHVVIFDTGGGQSTSVAPLKEAFTKASKPIVAFIDGNMHSAGVFAGVHAKEIVALPGSFMGSIGTFIGIEGMPQNHTDKDGKVYRRIYATTSGKKNLEFEEALKGNDAPIQKNLLDPHDKQFMDAVREQRPNVTDEQLEGGFFQVENLVGTLVDSIGDLSFAISRAAELAQKNKQNQNLTNNSNSKNNMDKPEFKVLAKSAGLETLEVADNGIFLSTDQAEKVQSELTTLHQNAEAYSGLKEGETVDGLQSKIAELTQSNSDLTEKNQTLTTENEKLSKETVKETGAVGEGDNDLDKNKVVDAEAQHYYELSKIK